MIFTFPVEGEELEACIAWGKVRPDRDGDSSSPVSFMQYQNGSKRFSFRMSVITRKVSGRAVKERWNYEDANVSVWARDYDTMANKQADVFRLLRSGDPVIVFGRHRGREWQDRNGEVHRGHEIYADIVIPAAWLDDICLALFSQIVANATPPRLRATNQTPPKEKQPKVPQITHPTVMDDKDGWFD